MNRHKSGQPSKETTALRQTGAWTKEIDTSPLFKASSWNKEGIGLLQKPKQKIKACLSIETALRVLVKNFRTGCCYPHRNSPCWLISCEVPEETQLCLKICLGRASTAQPVRRSLHRFTYVKLLCLGSKKGSRANQRPEDQRKHSESSPFQYMTPPSDKNSISNSSVKPLQEAIFMNKDSW